MVKLVSYPKREFAGRLSDTDVQSKTIAMSEKVADKALPKIDRNINIPDNSC